ncbi:MAG TPA: quinolinate synthase NadA [Vicinamibacterales bacterium]|nr:quinolinate synthase NadA [Vicinamibacterales bacterium]
MPTAATLESAEEIYTYLRARLRDVVPDVELRYKAELAAEINVLKRERNALILGHNYMEPALFHSIADVGGDSLELSRAAAKTDKDIIVFCGVRFMAETAKILNPTRTVLLPTVRGGCSLADGITAADVRALRAQYPGVPVVTYINTSADVKAESDIICTSGNAARVVESLDTDTVIFLPDEYLAGNVARATGRNIIFPTRTVPHRMEVPGPTMKVPGFSPGLQHTLVGWNARCEVHDKFTVEDVENVRRQFPDTVILAHPECRPEVVAVVDFTGSTSAMIDYVERTNAPRYLLLTECSMGDNVAAANQDKDMLRMCSVRCPHMNEITLEDTLESLRQTRYVIEIPEDIQQRARLALDRMLAVG